MDQICVLNRFHKVRIQIQEVPKEKRNKRCFLIGSTKLIFKYRRFRKSSGPNKAPQNSFLGRRGKRRFLTTGQLDFLTRNRPYGPVEALADIWCCIWSAITCWTISSLVSGAGVVQLLFSRGRNPRSSSRQRITLLFCHWIWQRLTAESGIESCQCQTELEFFQSLGSRSLTFMDFLGALSVDISSFLKFLEPWVSFSKPFKFFWILNIQHLIF